MMFLIKSLIYLSSLEHNGSILLKDALRRKSFKVGQEWMGSGQGNFRIVVIIIGSDEQSLFE